MSVLCRGAVSFAVLCAAVEPGVLGCGGEARERWLPAVRLIELTTAFVPERSQPMTRLGGEGRPVLRAFPEFSIKRRFAERKGESDRAVAWFPLPEARAGVTHMVLSPEIAPTAQKSLLSDYKSGTLLCIGTPRAFVYQ